MATLKLGVWRVRGEPLLKWWGGRGDWLSLQELFCHIHYLYRNLNLDTCNNLNAWNRLQTIFCCCFLSFAQLFSLREGVYKWNFRMFKMFLNTGVCLPIFDSQHNRNGFHNSTQCSVVHTCIQCWLRVLFYYISKILFALLHTKSCAIHRPY